MTHKEQFETVGDGLLVRAPAKINLSLLIVGKRPDGFHEIETVMAKVNWYDEIFIEPGPKSGIELFCEGKEWVPEGQDNLVYKACRMLLDICAKSADIKVTLRKNIPAGSGLGSASSDAAATLIGINKFLGLGLSQCWLSNVGAQLGSDIPFFLGGPLAFCSGRGEKIKKLEKNFDFSALLVLPDVSVSTKKVYANYKSDESLFRKLTSRTNSYLEKNRIDLVAKMCTNMLEGSCFSLYKEIGELKKKIESLRVGPLCLSGSGASMFYIIDTKHRDKLEKDKCELEEKIGCKSIIVSNNRW